MSTAETGLLECTASGFIQDVEDVHSALDYYFGISTGKDDQLAGKNPIHHYHVCCYTASNNPLNHPEEAFSTLQGILKHYQCLVKKQGIVYIRQRSCCFWFCMAELIDGTLTWGSMHAKVASSTANNMNSDTNLYCFDKCDCEKKSEPGIVAE